MLKKKRKKFSLLTLPSIWKWFFFCNWKISFLNSCSITFHIIFLPSYTVLSGKSFQWYAILIQYKVRKFYTVNLRIAQVLFPKLKKFEAHRITFNFLFFNEENYDVGYKFSLTSRSQGVALLFEGSQQHITS